MNDSYKKIVEQFAAEGEDNLWLITMTDLMSLLLVCFLMFFVISKRHEKLAEKARQQQPVAECQIIDKEQTPKATSAPDVSIVMAGAVAPDNLTTAEMTKSAPEMTASAVDVVPEPQSINGETAIKATSAPEVANQPVADDVKMAAGDSAPELDAVIRAQKLENDVTVARAGEGIVITMREKVSFVPGSAVILKNTTPVLDKVAQLIKRHPSYAVEIDGHTDNSPIHSPLFPSNWELSSARAMSVLQYLINVKGVDPSGFSVRGNGDSRPIVPNDSPQHMAQNRRVEIRIKEKSI
ncbi:OmpA family protein [Candidatus Magnetominusculus dajiuhuensis]|uniref:OmpA family protein n=1 Tax=Candidatus Magnetominusculus dajiuhuensis TaxID=3137712 RepID=UPI003B43A376